MYYLSERKSDLENYNNFVSVSENYDGENTVSWASIFEHPTNGFFAIKKHPKYEFGNLQEIENLDVSWFPTDPTI